MKTVENGSLKLNFYTEGGMNTIEALDDLGTKFILTVTKHFGNYWYRYAVKNGASDKLISEILISDAILRNDKKKYQRLAKEVCGFDVKPNKKKWEAMVLNETKLIYGEC